MPSSRIDFGEYTILMIVYVLLYSGIMFAVYWFFGESTSIKETVAMAVSIVLSSVIFTMLVINLYQAKSIKTNPNLLS